MPPKYTLQLITSRLKENMESSLVTVALLWAAIASFVAFSAKYVVYWTCGIWIGHINLLLWRAKGIVYKNKAFTLEVKSLKIRFNAIRKNEKLIGIIAEGVTIELNEKIADVGMRSSAPSSVAEKRRSEKEMLREYLAPVSIFPKTYVLKLFFRYAARFVPSVGVTVKDIDVTIKTTPIRLKLREAILFTNNEFTPDRQSLRYVTVAKVALVKLSYGQEHCQISTGLWASVGGNLDMTQGILSNITTEFKAFSLRIPVLTLLKCYIVTKRNLMNYKKTNRPVLKRSNESTFSRNVCLASLTVNLVKEHSIRFDSITLDKIPLLTQEQLRHVCDDDFDAKYSQGGIFLKASIKSASANYAALSENNAGYDINFQKDDRPFQTVITLMQSILLIDFTHSADLSTCSDSKNVFELLNIPSITVSSMTNTLYQLVKKMDSGSKVADSILNFNCSVSNPILDASTDHLGSLLSRLKSIRIENTLQKFKEGSTQDVTLDDFSKLDYLYYLSAIWPTTSVKLLIERPTFILKTRSKKDASISMIVASMSLVSIELTTSKRLAYDESLIYYLKSSTHFSDFSVMFLRRSTGVEKFTASNAAMFELAGDQKIIKATDFSIKFNSRILPDLRAACAVDYSSFSVDLSNLVILNGLAEIATGFMDSLQLVAKDKIEQLQGYYAQRPPKKKLSAVLEDHVFRSLPDWFDSLKIGGRHLKIIVGSRSVLIPAEKAHELLIPDIIDNVDGNLRKISLTVADWDLDVNNNNAQKRQNSQEQTSKSSNTNDDDDDESVSDSSFSEEKDYDEYWRVTLTWKNSQMKVYTEAKGEEGETNPYAMKAFNCSKIPNFVLILSSAYDSDSGNPRLALDGHCDSWSVHYSLMNHFLILSSFHLLHNTLFVPVKQRCQQFSNLKKTINMERRDQEAPIERLKQLLKVLHVQFNIRRFNIVTHFAKDFKIKVDGLKGFVSLEPNTPVKLASQLCRLSVESATSPGFWSRFLVVNNSRIYLYILKAMDKMGEPLEEMGTLIEFTNTGARLTVPHQFVVHNLFDQCSVAFKTAKQLHHSLKYNNNEIVIFPHEMKTAKLPKMKIKSKRFIFKMDDDPFESELVMIFQLGIIEQRRRLEKEAHFKERVAETLSPDAVETYYYQRNLNVDGLIESNRSSKANHTYTFPHVKADSSRTSNSTLINSATSEKAPKDHTRKVDAIDKKLFFFRKHLSRSWIELFRDYSQRQNEQVRSNSKFLWDFLKPLNYPSGFNHKMLSYPSAPPLMSMIMENVDLTIKSPNFPLEKVPEYIHDIGKGVPLDTKYTIMLPSHIDLKMKEMRIHIRDYPLPLVYIPKVGHDQPQSLAAFRVCGTFIVAETLSTNIENIRKIYVPLVPAAKEGVNDKYFGLEVPKTIASVKLYTNLQMTVNSKNATRIAWAQSYTPAIQQIILNLDDFTKPQLDLSEKIGFWDKIRSVLHARVAWSWPEDGELVVSFKGGRDPYALGGLNAGFSLGFNKHITLDINKDDDPKTFISAKAHQVTWSVANHLALPLLVWCKESNDALFVPEKMNYHLGSVVGYYVEEQETITQGNLNKMSKAFSDKTVIDLRGNVEFKIGISFERDEKGQRVSNFRPHYDVQLRNPKFVKDRDNYDAYGGFRSHYAHLSFSLVSPRGITPENVDPNQEVSPPGTKNVVHFSPKAFTQFFAWWKLFSNNMQLPVRRGNLFGPNKASKKFSEVLSTLQFQFLISPLYMSHIYREDVAQNQYDNATECVGLKAKADSFTVDLHQRKEAIINKNSELDKTKNIQKMKMYLGEVDVSDVDLRTVKAFFKNDENADFEDGDDVLNFAHTSNDARPSKVYSFDNDASWFDWNDFEEVALPTLKGHRYMVKIYPVLFTPRFSYMRQLDHTIPRGVSPGDNYTAHECVLGRKHFEETQRVLLENRLQELEAQLSSANSKRTVDQLTKGVSAVKKLLDDVNKGEAQSELVDNDTESGFNNKFLIHNMQVKWNKYARDIIYKYIHYVSMRRAVQHYLRYQSYSVVDQIVQEQKKQLESETAHSLSKFQTLRSEYLEEHHAQRKEFTYDDISCSERLLDFDADLRDVLNNSFRSSDDYLIKAISPQIQLCTEDTNSDSCVLVTSPEIEIKIVSIKQASSYDESGKEIIIDDEDVVLEKRYGSLFKDANIFVIYKKDVVENSLSLYSEESYGSISKWPPWIGVELCHDGESLKDNMLLQKTSLVFRYDQLRELIRKTSLDDRQRIIVDVPKVITACDSNQYFSFYDMVFNLLMYKEPSDAKFHDKLTSLILTTDFADLDGIKDRIRSLQLTYSILSTLNDSLAYKRSILTDDEKSKYKLITKTQYDIYSEIALLMRLISKGSTTTTVNKDEELEWTIRADDITVHMLDETRRPFIDLVVKDAVFRRIEESSNANANMIQVSELTARNLVPKALFPDVIATYNLNGDSRHKKGGHSDSNSQIQSVNDDKEFIVEWAMDKPVGGIKVIRNVVVNLLPLKISMEQSTGEKLFNYLFPPTTTTNDSTGTTASKGRGRHKKKQVQRANLITANNQVKQFAQQNESELDFFHRVDEQKKNAKEAMENLRKKSGVSVKKDHSRNSSSSFSYASSEKSSARSSMDCLIDSPTRASFESTHVGGNASKPRIPDSATTAGTSFIKSTDPKYVSEMINRASTYMSIVALTINEFVLNISFRGEGRYRLINVSNLSLTMPKLQYHNKIWTIEDLFNHVKKVVIKALLNHSGVILANKLTHHKRPSIKIAETEAEANSSSS